MNIQLRWTDLVALLLGGVLLWQQGDFAIPNLPSPSAPVSPVAAPSAELQAAVEPVKAILAGNPNRKAVAAFFRASAAEVRDNTAIDSTARVRAFNEAAGKAMVRRIGQIPGLSSALSKSMESTIGLESVALDAAKRKQAADWFDAVAWAAGG